LVLYKEDTIYGRGSAIYAVFHAESVFPEQRTLDIEISKEIYLEPFFVYTPAKEEGIFTRNNNNKN
jgi:hypothetical protein